MIDIDRSLFFQLINLLFLLWILNTILYRPIRKIVKERDLRMGTLEADLSNMMREIESRNEQMVADIKQARIQGFNQKEELRKTGLQQEGEIVGEAGRRAEKKIVQVREEISSSIAGARESLKSELKEFSGAVAEKILGRKLV
jgi:F-type H+-transporting ATPase subunit b